MRWEAFARARPDLAASASSLFSAFSIGYLATLRHDGAPRVHPVTVTLVEGGLYVSIVGSTHKARDLLRDGRYALHAFPRLPTPNGWQDEEFMLGGRAVLVGDPDLRARVLAAHDDVVSDDDLLFELELDRAFHKHRSADGSVIHEVFLAPRSA
jgi:hypothetical protein